MLATTLDNSTLDGDDYNNALLYMNISATGQRPNTNSSNTTFTHENFFHATSLAQARLVDPGLELTFDNETETFTVEAKTGVAVWTWLDYSAGPLVNFEDNGFLLLPGQEEGGGGYGEEGWDGWGVGAWGYGGEFVG